MFTSVEVLQELMHVLFAVDRSYEFDAAMNILTRYGIEVLPLELEDIQLARKLRDHHPNLSARDLCHLASCKRNDIEDLITFDAALSRAFYST